MHKRFLSITMIAAACASSGAPNSLPVTTTTFAPALGVDLSSMQATPSGVYVRDLNAGDGKVVARGSVVAVRYRGWLANGTPIDSTTERERPVSFRVGNHTVMRGWEEGLIGMRAGGRRMLVVPPSLGYGGRGNGPVPPNAVLVFTIDLVDAR